jgi:hypothetical protein
MRRLHRGRSKSGSEHVASIKIRTRQFPTKPREHEALTRATPPVKEKKGIRLPINTRRGYEHPSISTDLLAESTRRTQFLSFSLATRQPFCLPRSKFRRRRFF